MNKGYFEFWNLNAAGEELDKPIRIYTVSGLIFNCHHRCSMNDIRHLAEIARKTHDYPVDITVWRGPENARVLEWSARIYWRSQNNGQ